MPPKLPKLVPWHSPAEFIQMHQWFYPQLAEDGTPDIRAQECALRRVKAWEARGKLPHAIDSTAAFVSAQVRDWTQTCSDQDLRLMYSMVFIRFVNGYVDAFQSSKSAKSIAYLAVEKVGMPVWFVELRHTATHDYLPSLTILRSATQQALAWINDNYWIPQLVSVRMDEMLTPEMLTALSEDVRQMIENYKQEKERQIEANTMPQPKQETVVIGRLVRDLIKRCRSGEDLLATLIPIMLEPGMLIPKSKKMRSSARDLSLDNLGRMVSLCWMPLMTKLHTELKATISTENGEPLSFWVSLMDGMLEKLIEANNAAQAAALPAATVAEKSAAKTGSYFITILAWMKHLIKLHYSEQLNPVRSGRTVSSSSSSPSLSGHNSPPFSLPSSTPRLSIAAMASQLVAENAAASQGPSMFENDDIINIVEDCLQNILVHVSPLIRSVLNTVIECDSDIKEKIGPILKQIDQRIVAGSSAATPMGTVSSASSSPSIPSESTSVGGVWHEGPAVELQSEDTNMASEAAPETDSEMGDGQAAEQGADDQASAQAAAAEPWTLYDADEWRPCPMGCLPGGIIPDLSLPWDLDSPPIARVMI
ncbi:Las1-like-domain-containing protein [Gamsiella multidivaricata]|uniref:Las1-like-domain-containing protein n=1 Tax=Gamsiella multidivaricata TaxID=101098 RepID=UPI00221F6D3C|nr:Las1-like-domain-containing protein [Gamsiella multidivaricata]KAI7825104.1 Las1-like-domain-containing protein [Gamsiella multidivaricata]